MHQGAAPSSTLCPLPSVPVPGPLGPRLIRIAACSEPKAGGGAGLHAHGVGGMKVDPAGARTLPPCGKMQDNMLTLLKHMLNVTARKSIMLLVPGNVCPRNPRPPVSFCSAPGAPVAAAICPLPEALLP
eukprot:gene18902-25460_t